jgi:hypothetical protein
MACTAIWMTYGIYWGATKQIYTFDKPEQLAAFVTFTNYQQWVTATIALWYIGVQTAANFKNASSVASMMSEAFNTSSEKNENKNININIDETVPNMNTREAQGGDE